MLISCKRLIFKLLCVFVMIGCENHDKQKYYVEMNLQRAVVDYEDINFLFDNMELNLLSEIDLNNSIEWKKMILIDTIHLTDEKDVLNVFKANEANETTIVYQTKDSINLLFYFTGINVDNDKILILKNDNYKKTLNLLVKNEKFIVNTLSDKLPLDPNLDTIR